VALFSRYGSACKAIINCDTCDTCDTCDMCDMCDMCATCDMCHMTHVLVYSQPKHARVWASTPWARAAESEGGRTGCSAPHLMGAMPVPGATSSAGRSKRNLRPAPLTRALLVTSIGTTCPGDREAMKEEQTPRAAPRAATYATTPCHRQTTTTSGRRQSNGVPQGRKSSKSSKSVRAGFRAQTPSTRTCQHGGCCSDEGDAQMNLARVATGRRRDGIGARL
jgi:hypothetical protein